MKKIFLFTIILTVCMSFIFSQNLRVTSPRGGEKWIKGSSYDITWNCNGCKDKSVKINIFKNKILRENYTGVQLKGANNGKMRWVVPANFASGKYVLRIKAGSVIGDSGVFSISDKGGQPAKATLSVTSPRGGEKWIKGSSYDITWNCNGCKDKSVKINIFKNPISQANYTKVQLRGANNGRMRWVVPANFASGRYILRIKAGSVIGDSGVFNVSGKKASSGGDIVAFKPDNRIKNGVVKTIDPMVLQVAYPPVIEKVTIWSNNPKLRGQIYWGDNFDVKVRLRNNSNSIDKNNWNIRLYVKGKLLVRNSIRNATSNRRPGESWEYVFSNLSIKNILTDKSGIYPLKVTLEKSSKTTIIGVLKSFVKHAVVFAKRLYKDSDKLEITGKVSGYKKATLSEMNSQGSITKIFEITYNESDTDSYSFKKIILKSDYEFPVSYLLVVEYLDGSMAKVSGTVHARFKEKKRAVTSKKW